MPLINVNIAATDESIEHLLKIISKDEYPVRLLQRLYSGHNEQLNAEYWAIVMLNYFPNLEQKFCVELDVEYSSYPTIIVENYYSTLQQALKAIAASINNGFMLNRHAVKEIKNENIS
jgi:hypothetical protein